MPMSLQAGPGKGRVIKRVDKPKPGIVARRFEAASAKIRHPASHARYIEKAVEARANKIFKS